MEDNATVRRLVEILSAFYTEKRPVEEDLTCFLTNEFLQNIQIVLLTKQTVIIRRWKNFYHVCGDKMLSPEMFLRYIIYACRLESKLNFNIFEKFLGVFALVLYLNEEAHTRTDMNFCKLIPDLFMAFYSSELKKLFCKRGGFLQFAKYINNPNYISLKSSNKGLSTFFDSTAAANVLPIELAQQTEKVSHEENDLLKNVISEAEKDWFSSTLVQNILNSTKIDLPTILSDAHSKIMRDSDHEEVVQSADAMKELEDLDAACGRSFNSDSETSDDIGQLADKSQCENIFEAVMRYNHSVSSCHEKVNNRIQKEASGILDHLKDNIQFFIELLDEYDKE